MKRKFDKKIISGLIISLLGSQMMSAMAQGVSTQSNSTAPTIASLPALTVASATAVPPGCSSEMMQVLNSQYLANRNQTRLLQYNNQMNGLVSTTPKANQMDCFQQAMQNIKNLMSAINSIIALFSGEVDMDAAMQQLVNMVLKAACQEVNQVTGTYSGTLNTYTNEINSNVGAVTNTQVGVTGTGGPTTSVGSLLNANSTNTTPTGVVSGSTSGVTSILTSIGTTATNASNASSSLVGKLQSVSPFSSGSH